MRAAWVPAAVTVLLVALVVGGFVAVRALRPPPRPLPPPSPAASPADVLAGITHVSQAELDAAGAGSVGGLAPHLRPMNEPPLTAGGLPEVLYIGAEYCPFCAAERWSLIVALSRFGTLTGLQLMTSTGQDAYPNTATFTFRTAKFTSAYLSFVPVEAQDRQGDALETPTAAEQALEDAYAGGIPFVDFGNRHFTAGAIYSPAVLQGLSWTQIEAALADPRSGPAAGILGGANVITAVICGLTAGRPAAVCDDPVVQGIAAG